MNYIYLCSSITLHEQTNEGRKMSQDNELSGLMAGLKIEEKTTEENTVPWYDEPKNLPNIVKCQEVVREWLVRKCKNQHCKPSSFTENPIKFNDGEGARKKWAKKIEDDDKVLCVQKFREINSNFVKIGDIVLDPSKKRQTTIMVNPCNTLWDKRGEYIYIFVYNDKIVKIGGTRTSMKERFGSYLCGHHVCERGKSGKMSVTNAHLYHTIENTLLLGEKWEIWGWCLPREVIEKEIMGEVTKIAVQTYHAYEAVTMKIFKKLTGHYPILSDNCDPSY